MNGGPKTIGRLKTAEIVPYIVFSNISGPLHPNSGKIAVESRLRDPFDKQWVAIDYRRIYVACFESGQREIALEPELHRILRRSNMNGQNCRAGISHALIVGRS